MATPQGPAPPDPQGVPALLAVTGLFLAARSLSEIPAFKEAVKRAEKAPRQKATAERILRRNQQLRQAGPAQGAARQVKRPATKPKQRPVSEPVRRRTAVRPVVPAVVPAATKPSQIAELIALEVARSARRSAVSFLQSVGLNEELEHLLSLEERLTTGTGPALFHAALSTRHVLAGVADCCFSPRVEPFEDRFGRRHEVKQENVKNRLAAFVDLRLRAGLSDEEHRLFVDTLDTVSRWCGRGPHRIYHPFEARQFFLRLLDVLATISRAHRAPQP